MLPLDRPLDRPFAVVFGRVASFHHRLRGVIIRLPWPWYSDLHFLFMGNGLPVE
jgi:hypothetical protein